MWRAVLTIVEAVDVSCEQADVYLLAMCVVALLGAPDDAIALPPLNYGLQGTILRCSNIKIPTGLELDFIDVVGES